MLKRIFIFILSGTILLNACTSSETGMEVHDAWMRPAAQGENDAVYLVLHNHSSSADELTGAFSDIAEAIEMHESAMVGDVMQMNKIESISLEAFAEVEFAPGGFHIMLVHLQRDIHVGDEIQILLQFKNHDDIQIMVPVQESAQSEHGHPTDEHSAINLPTVSNIGTFRPAASSIKRRRAP